MSAGDVLAELVAAGVVLSADGDRLRYRAPAGTMTADRLGRLRASKADVLRLVADPEALRVAVAAALFDAEPDPDVLPVEPVRCFACRTALDSGRSVCSTCHPPAGITG